MKVLLISYYFDPFPGVGAKRASYWAENAKKFGIDMKVLTATPQPIHSDRITYIEPIDKKKMLGYFIKDAGLNWITPLKNYFAKLDQFDFDFVIITGGPFMHFSIANYLFKKFKAKVILDFRDPFSTNPSFNDSWPKRKVKSILEKQFIRNASAVIAVNDYCAKLIVSSAKNIQVIDNGFDENFFEDQSELIENDVPIIAHAGTFIAGIRDPQVFLQTLKSLPSDSYKFYQYGQDSSYFDVYRNDSFFNYKGMLAYSNLIEDLKSVDICLIVTEGKSFESTTKVFDYIGLNKKILIVTKSRPMTGNLHELTKTYPQVEWARNYPNEIINALNKLKDQPVLPFNPHPFSRAASLEKLVALLRSLN